MTLENKTLLFCGGCPRSGTTALTRFLNEHPDVAITHERYGKRLRDGKFDASLLTAERVSTWDEEDGNPRSFDNPQTVLAREKWADAKVVGDKLAIVPALLKTASKFPGCKVIIIVREPHGMAQSAERRARDEEDSWGERRDHKNALSVFNASMRALKAALNTSAEERGYDLMVLAYDDFFFGSMDPKDVYRFLGVDPEKAPAKSAEVTTHETKRCIEAKVARVVFERANIRMYRDVLEHTLGSAKAPSMEAAKVAETTLADQ